MVRGLFTLGKGASQATSNGLFAVSSLNPGVSTAGRRSQLCRGCRSLAAGVVPALKKTALKLVLTSSLGDDFIGRPMETFVPTLQREHGPAEALWPVSRWLASAAGGSELSRGIFSLELSDRPSPSFNINSVCSRTF